MSFIKKVIASSLFVGMIVPVGAGAQNLSDLQSQIAALLAQVQSLQAQLKGVQGGQGDTFCFAFNRNLRIGDSGTDVEALRKVLGLESGTEFSEAVAAAVVGFQEKYADQILKPNNLARGSGYVGFSTRTKLNQLYGCGEYKPYPMPEPQPVPVPPSEFSEVSGSINKLITWNNSVKSLLSDGQRQSSNTLQFLALSASTIRSLQLHKSVTQNQTAISLVEQLVQLNEQARSLPDDTILLGIVQQTDTILRQLQKLFSSNTNKTPIVYGVKGPTQVQVGKIETWSVNAYNPEEGPLSYSVVWGDEHQLNRSLVALPSTGAQSSVTFTHVYNSPGKYQPLFYVSNSSGQKARTSISVLVTGGDIYETTSTPPLPATSTVPAPCSVTSPGTNQFTGCVWKWKTDLDPASPEDGIPAGNAPSGPILSSPISGSQGTLLHLAWHYPSEPIINSYAGSDKYTARWKGSFSFAPGNYRFTAGADDGIRVRVNGETKIDQWYRGALHEHTFELNVPTSGVVSFEVDYFEHIWSGEVKLMWERLTSSEIPATSTSLLYAAPTMTNPTEGAQWNLGQINTVIVNPVSGASGYLFGFKQDLNGNGDYNDNEGDMIHENWRDLRQLVSQPTYSYNFSSTNGFRPGNMEVWVRALINGQWTDARVVNVTLISVPVPASLEVTSGTTLANPSLSQMASVIQSLLVSILQIQANLRQ